jgi:hypothetical protein
VYMPFSAPIGAGGPAEPFTPLAFDAGGNPLPLQGNPSAATLPANPWTAGATSAGGAASLLSSGSSGPLPGTVSGSAASPFAVGAPSGAPGGVPVVLPWVDYGGGAAGGSPGAAWQGSAQRGSDWGIFGPEFGGGSGEPPWSDAIAGGGCGCKKSFGLSPWLILAIVVVAAVVVFSDGE